MDKNNYMQKFCGLLKVSGELAAYDKKCLSIWQEKGISEELAAFACEISVLQTSRLSFAYANKLIEHWQNQGLQTVEEIKAALEKATQKKVSTEDPNKIRRLVNVLLKEHENDKPATYAHVCNELLSSGSDETLLAIKRELEHRITLDVMEEYSWEKTDTGEWRYVTPEEFSARFWADRKKTRSEAD